MSTQEITSTNNIQRLSTAAKDQYSLWQILGVWLAAGAPMWILSWIVYPWMSIGLAPIDAGLLRMKFLTAGMVWQFVLAMIILHHEEGNIRLRTISRRFWLSHPKSARSGETKKTLWWWLIPLIVLYAAFEVGLRSTLVDVWTAIFPLLAEPEGYDFAVLFTPEMRPQLVGAWGLFGLYLASSLFNTFLGEELIFRGVLLPKMGGVFGQWDWVANGILFSFYHLHQPWGILATIPGDLVLANAGKRFHCNWFPIILHSGQTVFFLLLIVGVILGLP